MSAASRDARREQQQRTRRDRLQQLSTVTHHASTMWGWCLRAATCRRLAAIEQSSVAEREHEVVVKAGWLPLLAVLVSSLLLSISSQRPGVAVWQQAEICRPFVRPDGSKPQYNKHYHRDCITTVNSTAVRTARRCGEPIQASCDTLLLMVSLRHTIPYVYNPGVSGSRSSAGGLHRCFPREILPTAVD